MNSSTQSPGNKGYIAGGLLAAISASICCIGPFAVLATGLSAAWIGKLMVLEPYQPVFTVLAVGLFIRVGWRIFKPALEANSSTGCSVATRVVNEKLVFLLCCGLAAVLLTSSYWVVLLP